MKNVRSEWVYKLWLAAKSNVIEVLREDEDSIRFVRDNATDALYGKFYKELSVSQLKSVVRYLNKQSGFVEPQLEYASVPAKKKLWRESLLYAATYYEHKGEFVNPITGEILQGRDVNKFMQEYLERGVRLPRELLNKACRYCINPKLNKLLHERSFRKKTKSPSNFYIDNLKIDECNALIQYLQQVNLENFKKNTTVSAVYEN